MATLLQALDRFLPDPHPPLVFEIGSRSLAGARRAGRTLLAHAGRWLDESHGQEHAEVPPEAALQGALDEVLQELGPLPGPQAAVLLPDDDTRLAVFEFDRVPRRAQDLRRAVEERFRNSLPFDSGAARIACCEQGGRQPASVLATACATASVRRYERVFAAAGLMPVYVGPSLSAALCLLEDPALSLILKLGGRAMNLVAVENGTVRLVRRIELPASFASDRSQAARELLADVFPTLVYLEESLDQPVRHLLLCDLGDLLEPAIEAFSQDLECAVAPLAADGGPGRAGLLGYVHG